MSIGNKSFKFFNFSRDPVDQYFFDFLNTKMTSEGLKVDVESFEVGSLHWNELVKVLDGASAARLDFQNSEGLVSEATALPTEVKELTCADTLFFTDGQWWPRLNLKESLRRLIVERAKALNIKESAYIIGQGADLRHLASLAISFGYSKIYLVGLDEEDPIKQKDLLKSYFVGIDWRPIDATQLTMQTVGATILINAIPLSQHPALLSDLAYFNFMKSQGLVVDLETLFIDHPLLVEGQRAGLRVLTGIEARCSHDYQFLERVGLSSLWTFADFSKEWSEFLKSKASG